MKRLSRDFFKRHPKETAPELLGKYLVVKFKNKEFMGKIVETEAYGGKEDLACHVGRFGYNQRTKILFEEVGRAYVYPVHINTYCLNIVCHKENDAGGILIRALEPIKGIELILKNLNKQKEKINPRKLLNGPGKLCKALKINRDLNGEDLIKSRRIYLLEGEKVKKEDISATPRINIPYAKECKNWLWRFIIKDSEFLSRKPQNTTRRVC